MAQQLREKFNRVLEEANLLADQQINNSQVQHYLKELWYLSAEVLDSALEDFSDLNSEIGKVSSRLLKIQEKPLQATQVSLVVPQVSDEKTVNNAHVTPPNATTSAVQSKPANPAPVTKAPNPLSDSERLRREAEVEQFIQFRMDREANTQMLRDTQQQILQDEAMARNLQAQENAAVRMSPSVQPETTQATAEFKSANPAPASKAQNPLSDPERRQKEAEEFIQMRMDLESNTKMLHDRQQQIIRDEALARKLQAEEDAAVQMSPNVQAATVHATPELKSDNAQIASDREFAEKLHEELNGVASRPVPAPVVLEEVMAEEEVLEQKSAPTPAPVPRPANRLDDISDEVLFQRIANDQSLPMLTAFEQAQQQQNLQSLMQSLEQSVADDFANIQRAGLTLSDLQAQTQSGQKVGHLIQNLQQTISVIKADFSLQDALSPANQILSNGLARIESTVGHQLDKLEASLPAQRANQSWVSRESISMNPLSFFNANNSVAQRANVENAAEPRANSINNTVPNQGSGRY